MISVDMRALALMTAFSVVLGAALALVLELLRFIWGIFSPSFLKSEADSKWQIIIGLFARDVLFFVICGVAFSIFIYYTNNGNVRFSAVGGTVLGFFGCYFTLSRLVRHMLKGIITVVHKLIYIVLSPLRLAVVFVRRAYKKAKANIVSKRKKYAHSAQNKDIPQ